MRFNEEYLKTPSKDREKIILDRVREILQGDSGFVIGCKVDEDGKAKVINFTQNMDMRDMVEVLAKTLSEQVKEAKIKTE